MCPCLSLDPVLAQNLPGTGIQVSRTEGEWGVFQAMLAVPDLDGIRKLGAAWNHPALVSRTDIFRQTTQPYR